MQLHLNQKSLGGDSGEQSPTSGSTGVAAYGFPHGKLTRGNPDNLVVMLQRWTLIEYET